MRPKVERKLAHLMRRKHGGRHARVRGRAKVDVDPRRVSLLIGDTRSQWWKMDEMGGGCRANWSDRRTTTCVKPREVH